MAKFAIEVESALSEYMKPLVAAIHSAATGKGKGLDWRAAKELLASRFPSEFSEKYAASANQKLEVSGEVSHKHDHYLKMDLAELWQEHDRLDFQISTQVLDGADLNDKIAYLEQQLADMRECADRGHPYQPGLARDRGHVVDEVPPPRKTLEISSAALVAPEGLAPIEADGAGFVQATPSAAPSPRRTGIGWDARDRTSGRDVRR